MAAWEDAELAFPHHYGTYRPLVGESDAQGDGRSPKVNRQDVGGLNGEVKWRPDRISNAEAGEIRRGRWEGPSQTGGAEGVCPTHSGTGSLLSSQADPLPSKPHSSPRGSLGA